jgi:hypothetical protein
MILSFDIGIKNLSYNIFDYNEKSIKDWKIICLSEKKKISIDELTPILLQKLIDLDLEKITHILIENQPVMKNPVMKSIQMIVYTYFHHYNILYQKNIHIKFISAMNKLKCGIDIEYPESIMNQKNKYMQKKKKAIYLCEHILFSNDTIITPNEEFKTLFKESKKKDDLADSFLYCIYYINKFNL